MSLINTFHAYQMDPGFHRLREGQGRFTAPGGSLDAPMVCVWDEPVSNENLAELLVQSGVPVEQVYITCLVKYDSPALPPTPQEIRLSRDYLYNEMRYLKPRVIVALGYRALAAFVKDAPPWNVARGQVFRTTAGTPVVPVQYLSDLLTAQGFLSEEFVEHG